MNNGESGHRHGMRGATLRDAVLDATETLLGSCGYQKMTMDEIAREAGVGRRTLYLHFSGKEEIALSSIDRVVERLLDVLRGIAAEARGPADERLRRMLITRVLFRFDSVHRYHQSLDSLFEALRPAYMARRSRYFAAEAAVFADVIADGQRQNVFGADGDPTGLAHTLLLATNALLPYGLSARELGERSEIEARITAIADLLLDGLRRSAGARFR